MALTYLLLIARACLHDAACVFFSPHAPCWHPSAAGRMLDTPGRGYRALGPAEGIAPSRRTGGTCGLVQCASLSLLIVAGGAILACVLRGTSPATQTRAARPRGACR